MDSRIIIKDNFKEKEFHMVSKNIKLNIKKTFLVGGATAAILAGVLPITAAVKADAPDINAEASLTVDVETGQILQGEEIDKELGIASMTKMMVEYIVFEELEAGNLEWETEITISDYAYETSQNYLLSNVPLLSGEVYTLQELYEAMAIYSANGATIAIAEHIAGSEPAFVDRMMETLESFGISDAKLYNASGLNNSFLGDQLYPGSTESDENTMSARSIAIVARRIINEYPEILEIASIPSMVFREETDAIYMENWNWMLEGLSHERPNVDGLKTGTTDFAGYAFTGSAAQDGRRLITVVMNAEGEMGDRFVETDRLMDFGFDQFEMQDVVEGWDQVYDYEALEVIDGNKDIVNFEASESLEMLMQLDDSVEEDVTYTIEWDSNIVSEDGTIEAPFEAGMEIGQLVVNYTGNELGHLENDGGNKVALVTSESVGKANVLALAWNWIVGVFDSIASRF